MRKLFIFLFLIVPVFAIGQKYDVIERINGERLACYLVDSETSEEFIKAKIKKNGQWVFFNLDRESIAKIEKNKFRKMDVRFKSGSSIIKEFRSGTTTLRSRLKNAITIQNDFLFTLSINYERIIPIAENTGFIARIGGGPTWESGMDPALTSNISFISGIKRHYIDLGVGLYAPARFEPSFIYHAGYRYIGFKGLYASLYASWTYFMDEGEAEAWGQYEFSPGLELGYRYSF